VKFILLGLSSRTAYRYFDCKLLTTGIQYTVHPPRPVCCVRMLVNRGS